MTASTLSRKELAYLTISSWTVDFADVSDYGSLIEQLNMVPRTCTYTADAMLEKYLQNGGSIRSKRCLPLLYFEYHSNFCVVVHGLLRQASIVI